VALAALLLPELPDDADAPPAAAPALVVDVLPLCADEVVAVDVGAADDADVVVAVVAPAMLTGMADVSR
jgi:hypothetical protein